MKVKHSIKVRRVPEYCAALRALREKRGAQQHTIAKRLGVSNMGLSNWELGKRPIKVEQLEEWANALGMEVVITIAPSQRSPTV